MLMDMPIGIPSWPATAACWSTSAQPPDDAFEHQYDGSPGFHTVSQTPPLPVAHMLYPGIVLSFFT